ncbi:MAG: ATP-binding protein, partial [Desulfofustis sp.]|nr:ATP-binding protein [Desulfofustis sp.]
ARVLGRDITINVSVAEVLVNGDRKELETIFENLFSNAIKFTPPGGTVGCRVRADRKNIACIVYDSGPGIPVGEEEKIFQPFYQVEMNTRSIVKGSGLGLAIVREYVKRNGGTIRVLNPGEPGARFGVTLPRAATVSFPERHDI